MRSARADRIDMQLAPVSRFSLPTKAADHSIRFQIRGFIPKRGPGWDPKAIITQRTPPPQRQTSQHVRATSASPE